MASFFITENTFAQPEKSPLFGKDIIISDNPAQDQRNIAICSAFNGWLFAAYSYAKPDDNYVSIYKSIDNGISWNLVAEGGAVGVGGWDILKLDIVAYGNSLENLKIFLAFAVHDPIDYEDYMVYHVNRFNGDPFYVEVSLLNDYYYCQHKHDIALASDYPFPASNSNPGSISAVYSKSGYSDTLICLTSSNGGESFDSKRIIAVTNKHIGNVDISYGRSPSDSSGRYYVVWEEKENKNSQFGHIYTAHSEPYFNSDFTAPVCLDSLSPSSINQCRRPVISCQNSDYDNTASKFTEVILCEKNNQTTNKNQVCGFYSLQATATNDFNVFSVTDEEHNSIQPDITFIPSDSSFYATYNDSTQHQLPLLSKEIEMLNPNYWHTNSTGYNDEASITSAFPRLARNFLNQTPIAVWINNTDIDYGTAMFDALNSTYTGLFQNQFHGFYNNLTAYPNPCSTIYNIEFELPSSADVKIQLMNVLGENLAIITDQTYASGKHVISFDVSKYPAGIYFYTIIKDYGKCSGKIHVQH
jgi:hypothetical protein